MKNNETAHVSNKLPLYLTLARCMKLTIAFMFLLCMQVSARGWSQSKITLRMNAAEIKNVLFAIEKKSDYRFLFNEEAIKNKPRVTIDVVDAFLPEVLDRLLANTGVGYKILGSNLVVLRQADGTEIRVQDIAISGRVVSSTGEALAGVSISVKGTRTGTTTDGNGNFSITVPDDAVLVFSAVGYETYEESAAGKTTMTVTLQQSGKQLDQVVVTGYGTQRRRSVTGAISRVSGDQLSKQPLLTPVQGMQGLAPGIQVTGSSQPGTQPRVTIRGLNTILTNENPLYVVDGVLTDDITNVNTADVLSVDVLKDGAAAIYGSRAANGVILITTRKGRSGKPNVTFDTYVGFRQLTNQVKMADRQLYLDYNNEARAYENVGPLTTLDNTANTDWFKEITRKGALQNYNLSVNGGNESVTYLFSVGYLKDKGILKGADYDRITIRSNNDYKLNKFIKVGHVLNVNIVDAINKPNGVFTDAYRASPAAPVRFNNNYGFQPGLSAAGNPLANIDLTNDFSKNQRFQGNLYTEATIIRGLTFRSAWGFDRFTGDNIVFSPTYNYGSFARTNTELRVSDSRRFYWVWDNILNYKTRFAENHAIDLTVGHTAEKDRARSYNARAADVPAERNLWYISQGNANSVVASDGGSLLQRSSIFGRANYSFMDKYNISGVLRRDGSSAFPTNQKYGTFYSIAGSWVISEEGFFKDIKMVDYLKIRGGYAKLGNDAISRLYNNELATLTAVTLTNPYGNTGIVDGITINKLPDGFATWETTKSVDVGLEFGLFERRLTGEISYYNKVTNAYIKVPTPPFVDPDGILQQATDVRNKGMEFMLGWNENRNKNFTWRVSANATINRNNVDNVRGGIDLKEGGLGNGQVVTSTVEGQPIGSFWVYQVEGIYQTQSEVDNSAHITGSIPGDFRYTDINKDNVIDERDRIFVGSYQPRFYYGLNGGFTVKQFDFSIDCYGNAGNKVFNGKKAVRFGNENIEADRADRWRTGNTNTGEYRASNQIPVPSTYFVESGAFFRINNVTLGYTLPSAISEKAFISRARFFVSAQNPVIIKKFSGFSPELQGSNALNSGIELSVYPTTATYMVGLNVNFR
jgi:TonB-linked SusC/RagA family outer membrane protein